MQTYEIDQKTIDAIAAAVEDFGRCIDTSTEHGRVLCGTLIKAALPWDASPNWELRHKSPTDALLVDGLPAWQFVDQSHLEDIYQTVLLASLRRGLPWAWSEQQAVFQRIRNREQYIEVGHAPAGDPSMPHVGCSGSPVTAPETITLSVGASTDRVRVGWIDIGAMLEHMPADLLQAAVDTSFQLGIRPELHSLVRKDARDSRYQLTIGTAGVRASAEASTAAVAALEYLRATSSERMTWVDLAPGQMLVLPNRFGQHAIQSLVSGCAVHRTYWSRDLRVHRELASTGHPMLFDQARLND